MLSRPLDATVLALVARFLEHPGPTICPRTRQGAGTLPFLQAEAARERMRRLWQSMKSEWQARKRPPRGPSPDVLRWHALYVTGLSLPELARQVGKDHAAIWRAFRKHNLPTRPRGHHNAARAKAA